MKSRWRSPLVLAPAIALLFLAVFVMLWIIPLISSRDAALDERAFRMLAGIGDQIDTRLTSIDGVAQKVSSEDKPENYLAAQAPNLEFDSACKASSCSGDRLNIDPILKLSPQDKPGYFFRFNAERISIRATVESIVTPFLPPTTQDIFDEILLAKDDGHTIYQTKRTGIRIDNLSELFAAGAPEASSGDKAKADTGNLTTFSRAKQVASLTTVPIGGTDYRLYVTPLAPVALQNAGDQQVLLVAGIIRKTGFQTKALAGSGTGFFWVILSVSIVLCGSWPLLKFSSMGHTERVGRSSGVRFLISTIATVSLVTLCILLLSDTFTERATTRNELSDLSKNINKNLGQELTEGLKALDLASKSPAYRMSRPDQGKPILEDVPEGNVLTDLLMKSDYLFASYPYLDQFFWLDGRGNQQIKWSVRRMVTPETNSAGYGYFSSVLLNDLWSLSNGQRSDRFRIEPLYSPNTGEYLAVVSRPIDPSQPPQGLRQAVLVSALASLVDPVLHPDYGFAIIDPSGLVLFHSSSSRNLRENFLRECGDDPDLRAAVTARNETYLDTTYQGSTHTLYISQLSSLARCPWTLIVFRNLDGLNARHFETMLLSGLLMCGFAAILLIVAGFQILFPTEYPPKWTWPVRKRCGVYLQVALASTVFLSAAQFWTFTATPSKVLTVMLCIGVAAYVLAFLRIVGKVTVIIAAGAVLLGMTAFWPAYLVPLSISAGGCFLLGSRRVWRPLQRLALRLRDPVGVTYPLAVLGLIALSSVPPALGFFKVAHDYESLLFQKRDQVLTLRALERRAAAIEMRYKPIRIGQEPGDLELGNYDPLRALFLRRRLLEYNLDRYDGMDPPKQREPRGDRLAEWKFLGGLVDGLEWIPNPTAALARNLAHDPLDRHMQSGSTWTLEDDWLLTTNSDGESEFARFASQKMSYVPEVLGSKFTPLRSLSWPPNLGLLVIIVLSFPWLRYALARLFVLDAPQPKPSQQDQRTDLASVVGAGRNTIAIGSPNSGKSTLLAQLPDLDRIDMAEDPSPEFIPKHGTGRAIVLDNFEFGIQDASIAARKVRLVEALLHKGKQPIIIVTNVDPNFYFGPGLRAARSEDSPAADLVSRWEDLASRFEPVQVEGPRITTEPGSFAAIWNTCTVPERIVFHQLAHDGWANHKNTRAIQHLLRRKLLVRDPALRFANEGFRRFVLEHLSEETAHVWEREEGTKAWDVLKVLLTLAAVAIVILLFYYAQQQALTIATAVLSGLGGGARMLSGLRASKLPADRGQINA